HPIWWGTHPAGRSPLRERACFAGTSEARHGVKLCCERTNDIRRRPGDLMTMTRPDVDLTDGAFYAGDSRAVYRWMRENEPVFRDRNGLEHRLVPTSGEHPSGLPTPRPLR